MQRCSISIPAVLLTFVLGCSTTEAKCFSMLGFSTCLDEDIRTKYPFSVPWFFANLEPRVSRVSDIVIGINKSPLGSVVGALPDYEKVVDAMETKILQRLLRQCLEYMQTSGEEPDLLYDSQIDPYDLYNCFEVYSHEIYAYLDSLCEKDVLTPDVKEFTIGSKEILGSLVTFSKMLPTASVRPYVQAFAGDQLISF